eukprot:CAMPEP_0167755704 /NCGR_PEP_ID=MMETSP0110_2-20121227/8975_1 /TAXON_ID=629695 /ORGANISM="Gymnochlora sp., Strain CCMP2014" /LENGTH=593 /DNA_ID=CAMNT_0007641727 /DNA_START=20 /DNA_END=1798 /DNA_ORIENTATION=-
MNKDPKRRLRTAKPEIRMPGRRPTLSGAFRIATSSKISICSTCQKERAKYTCPRCHAASCSLVCYKKHGHTCTEAFYEKQVREHKKIEKKNPSVKAKTLKVLERTLRPSNEESIVRDSPSQGQKQTSEEEEDNLMLRRAFQHMVITGDFDPNRLDEKSRKRFLKMAADGRLAEFVEKWVPWWHRPKDAGGNEKGELILPKVKDEQGWPNTGLTKSAPDLSLTEISRIGIKSIKIPSFTSLKAPKPSPEVRNTLIDLVFSYAFTMRLYNGDWDHDVIEACKVLYMLSDALSKNSSYSVPVAARNAVLSNTQRVAGINRAFAISGLRDAAQILYYKALTIRALIDIHRLLAQSIHAHTKFKAVQKTKGGSKSNNTKSQSRKKHSSKSLQKTRSGLKNSGKGKKQPSKADNRRDGNAFHDEKESLKEKTEILSSVPPVATASQMEKAKGRLWSGGSEIGEGKHALMSANVMQHSNEPHVNKPFEAVAKDGTLRATLHPDGRLIFSDGDTKQQLHSVVIPTETVRETASIEFSSSAFELRLIPRSYIAKDSKPLQKNGKRKEKEKDNHNHHQDDRAITFDLMRKVFLVQNVREGNID